MHSLNHIQFANASARARLERSARRQALPRPEHRPPPAIRGRAAFAAGRVARRLDRESARKAIA